MATGGDDNNDWDENAKTTADATVVAELASDPVTAPHDVKTLPGYEIGRRAGRQEKAKVCYEEGQEDIKGALRHELLFRGLTNEETAHLVLAVWKRRTRL